MSWGKILLLRQRLGDRLAVRHRLARLGDGLLDDAVGDDLLGDLQRGQHRHAVFEQRRERARELAEEIQLDHLAEDRRVHLPLVNLAPALLGRLEPLEHDHARRSPPRASATSNRVNRWLMLIRICVIIGSCTFMPSKIVMNFGSM